MTKNRKREWFSLSLPTLFCLFTSCVGLVADWPFYSINLTLNHNQALPLPGSTTDEWDHACLYWSDVLLCFRRLWLCFDWDRSAPACCWRTCRGMLAWPRVGKSARRCRCLEGSTAWSSDRCTRTHSGHGLRIESRQRPGARSADGCCHSAYRRLPFSASCWDKSLLRAAGNDHRLRVEELCRDNRFPSRTSARSPLANSLPSSLQEGQSFVAKPTHQPQLSLDWN